MAYADRKAFGNPNPTVMRNVQIDIQYPEPISRVIPRSSQLSGISAEPRIKDLTISSDADFSDLDPVIETLNSSNATGLWRISIPAIEPETTIRIDIFTTPLDKKSAFGMIAGSIEGFYENKGTRWHLSIDSRDGQTHKTHQSTFELQFDQDSRSIHNLVEISNDSRKEIVEIVQCRGVRIEGIIEMSRVAASIYQGDVRVRYFVDSIAPGVGIGRDFNFATNTPIIKLEYQPKGSKIEASVVSQK